MDMTFDQLRARAELGSAQADLVQAYVENEWNKRERAYRRKKIIVAVIFTSEDGERWEWTEVIRVADDARRDAIEVLYRKGCAVPDHVGVDVGIVGV